MKNIYTGLEEDDDELDLDNEMIKIYEIKSAMKDFM